MKKTVFVILDGLGDRSTRELGGKTPLEAAKTPNLNWFSKRGINGKVITVGREIAPESDIAVTAILGYDPYKFYEGRGPLEAYGAGLKIKEGNLCFRTNFATLENGKIIDRRAGRNLSTKEALLLEKAINRELKLPYNFFFKSTNEHRGALIIRGEFSSNITNTDPGYEKLGNFGVVGKTNSDKISISRALDNKKLTKISAELANEFTRKSFDILDNHPVNLERKKKGNLPANVILLRDAGTRLPKFKPKRKGWASVVAMPLEIALTKSAGMKPLIFNYPKVGNGSIREQIFKNLLTEIRGAKRFLRKEWGNFKGFYIHIKQTDIPGHDGDYNLKKELIETIDRDLIGFLRRYSKEMVLLVTGDHSTPCVLRSHSADPVPVLIYNGYDKDEVKEFGETMSTNGSLGILKGVQLMEIAKDLSYE